MAGNPITMTAINLSEAAIRVVFQNTSTYNFRPVEEVAKNSGAMLSTATVLDSLTTVADNTVAWSHYSTSAFYEQNVWDVVVTLVGLTKADNATISAMMINVSDVADITSNARGIAAVVASPDTFEHSQSSSAATELYADSAVAMNAVVAGSAAIQTILAASVELMGDIASRPTAFGIVANSIPSVQAIAANATGWTSFFGSASFPTYLKEIISAIAGLDGSHASVNAIIADASALALVAASAEASQAMSASSAAVTSAASSPNLGVLLGSTTAMAYFGTEANVLAFISVSSAVPTVFASSIAKGVIVGSTTLIDHLATNEQAYLESIMSGATIPSNLNVVGATNDWGGLPSKIISVKMRANNIGAIAGTYTFTGDVVAGSAVGATIALKGTVTETSIMGYTNAKWKVSGIAATAAASPEWKYIDMT
tara:strand:+ start:1462 stop:2742 length:1281 start_codon:yes stop_codon:yes gene_type:complete